MEPGQGNGRYSYAGAGFDAGECGLSIVAPNEFDRFTWKCFVGYRQGMLNGTLGAILDASVVPKELESGCGSIRLQDRNDYKLVFCSGQI